ncbi:MULTISPECIES: hypothetical protein [unclassified Streptomyces]|uniref:hypothetical protein n=1 Tax=unclassified Streptomyces TaxID=2593676 RepID=UPI000CD4D975|nr:MULTISPECIES: hypothetical protein [unclassified Streptomyces]
MEKTDAPGAAAELHTGVRALRVKNALRPATDDDDVSDVHRVCLHDQRADDRGQVPARRAPAPGPQPCEHGHAHGSYVTPGEVSRSTSGLVASGHFACSPMWQAGDR